MKLHIERQHEPEALFPDKQHIDLHGKPQSVSMPYLLKVSHSARAGRMCPNEIV